MNLPPVPSYSSEQRDRVIRFSAAFKNYLEQSYRAPGGRPEKYLRFERNRLWMECVMATCWQTASTQDICGFWSRESGRLIRLACAELLQGPEEASPFAVFVLGKLGAEELNLSSDVDLLVVKKSEATESQNFLRGQQHLLQERTESGFCYRLDYDLRPGGRLGPLVPTLEQMMDYYGNYGETWERLAYTRFRPLWGPPDLIRASCEALEKFVFRKHLDYGLMEDLKVLRRRVHEAQWEKNENNTFDLKLGIGGIRDLELFVHALQVVHGGRRKDLRTHSTQRAFELLKSHKLLPKVEAEFLQSHYWQLRHVENLLQAQNDQQTQRVCWSDPWLSQWEIDTQQLLKNIQRCDDIVSSLLGRIPEASFILPDQPQAQTVWLRSQGVSQSFIDETWPEIGALPLLSRNQERDHELRRQFLSLMILKFREIDFPLEKSLIQLKDFLKAIRAKSTFFSLFLNHPELAAKVAYVFATSPYLSRLLCNRPELLDSFIYSVDEKNPQDPEEYLNSLVDRKLLAEIHAGSDFLIHQDLSALNQNLTQTTDSLVRDLLATLRKEIPESEVEILTLGKWGGREMGLRSDLDFILVTPQAPSDKDLRLCRRLIHRLTETHRAGVLYKIDMRLRPAGMSGLLVCSWSELQRYLQEDAHAWERQAYLKSRWLQQTLTSPSLTSIYIEKGLSKNEVQELNRIRLELLKNATQILDYKYAEGGLVDLELSLQTQILLNKISPSSTHTFDFLKVVAEQHESWQQASEVLLRNYSFLRQIEQMYQLLSAEVSVRMDSTNETFTLIAQFLGTTSQELEKKLGATLSETSALLQNLDPRRLDGERH